MLKDGSRWDCAVGVLWLALSLLLALVALYGLTGAIWALARGTCSLYIAGSTVIYLVILPGALAYLALRRGWRQGISMRKEAPPSES